MKVIFRILVGTLCIGMGLQAARLEDVSQEEKDQILKKWFTSASKDEKKEVAKLADQYPRIINEQKPDSGKTALHIAAEHRAQNVAYFLANHKNININTQDKQERTPVHYAAMAKKPKEKAPKGHRDILKSLINNGADVTIQDKEGKTPLHYAAVGGHPDVLRLLMEHGADPYNAFKQKGGPLQTPIRTADENNNLQQMLNAMQKTGKKATYDKWFQAIAQGDKQSKDTIKELIERYPGLLFTPNPNGQDAKDVAKQHQNSTVIKLINQESLRNWIRKAPATNAVNMINTTDRTLKAKYRYGMQKTKNAEKTIAPHDTETLVFSYSEEGAVTPPFTIEGTVADVNTPQVKAHFEKTGGSVPGRGSISQDWTFKVTEPKTGKLQISKEKGLQF